MTQAQERSLAQEPDLLDEALQALGQTRYFATMSADLLRQVLQTGSLLDLPAEHALIREGETNDDLFFLLEGSLAVLSAQKLVLRLNTPGDIVGEFAVVSSSPRSADVVTETPARLVRVTSSVVKNAQDNPGPALEFYAVFSHIMAAKLTETSRRARLYEDALLEAQELATAHTRLETDIKEKLNEILLYSKVIESSNDAVIIADTAGTIVQTNPAVSRLLEALGIGEAAHGQQVHELLDGFDLGDYPEQDPTQPWRGEWTRGPEESQVVLQVTVTPIHGNHAELVGVAFQLRDISLQKSQERAIAAKNEEIRKALLNLEATYEELQRSDKLKTETLTLISRELTPPIRRILNHTGKIAHVLDELPPEEVASHVNEIHEQSEFLKIVAENINYLIDLQADLQTTRNEPFDVGEVLRQGTDELAVWAERKGVTFELEMPEQAVMLNGDPDQLRTILNLLLEQVLLVTRKRSRINVRLELADGQRLELEMAYRGPSLRLVDPHDRNRQGRMGLIIGVPMARKVVSQHQGSLQFEGDAEHGRVLLALPRTRSASVERVNRIMVVDEEEMDRLIARGLIEHLWPDAMVMDCQDPFDFLDNYEDFRPDLVIVDPAFSEAGWTNHRVLASLMQNRRHICPVLAVSALYRDFAERTIAVERGVSDFLAKPYSIFDMRFKVKSLLQLHRKQETLHQTMDIAQREAYTDGLTKLANRKHLDEFLDTQIEYSRQTRKPCSLIMLDVDNFKHYNDTHGHQLGDEVLAGVASILARSVRSSDLPARYGGEEFAVVLPETRKEMAQVIAEKVRRTIQEHDFPRANQQPLGFLSASFGVATFDEDANNAETLLKAADERLYLAKERGRNQVVASSAAAPDDEASPPLAAAEAT